MAVECALRAVQTPADVQLFETYTVLVFTSLVAWALLSIAKSQHKPKATHTCSTLAVQLERAPAWRPS